MAYQALLFCPDEKTARTVTQVLGELDFTVVPCTEPFGAVKKLMAEHFDAVVVDCDNEQNATLLFKSARNTTNNQSSLAVAVVEGQAGVAKAFRIGANLVLTKPINVEQAKGTLRVARGLLRKNESAKSTTPAASATVKPVAAAPAPPKLVPPRPIPPPSTAHPAASIAPLASAAKGGTPIQKPAPRPAVVASVPTQVSGTEPESLPAANEEVAEPVIAAPAAKVVPSASLVATAPAASQPSAAARVGSSAASAPAPAREKEAPVSIEEKQTVIAEPENVVANALDHSSKAQVEEGSAPSTSFTFGGNVSTGSGKKKTVLAVVVALLIVAVGYAVWMQWQLSEGYAVSPLHVSSQPARIPAAAPKVTPSPAPVVPIPGASPATSPAPPAAAVSQPREGNSSDSDTEAKAAEEKSKAGADNVNTKAAIAKSKPATSVGVANKAAVEKAPATKADPEPIAIKTRSSQPVAKPVESADAPAPSMAGIAPAGAGLPALVGGESKAPTPVLQTLHVSQGVSQGLLVKRTPPSYPPSALQMHIEGAVELLATISKNGDISAVKIVSGDPQLARAAADAVKRWKYKPYLLNGEPVEIQTQVTVNFKLP